MKTAKEHSPSSVRETEKNALVLRLELNQKDVKRLRGQLSSYRCEPTTYSLFERIELLRSDLDNLSRTNTEIIASLKEKKKKVDYYVERAKPVSYKRHTTYSLFERIELLRSDLDNLSRTNTEIIASLKEKKKKVDYYVERAKQQFSEFNNLYSGIEEYIQGTIGAGSHQEHIRT